MFKKKTLLDSSDPLLMSEIGKDIVFLMRKIREEKYTLSNTMEKIQKHTHIVLPKR